MRSSRADGTYAYSPLPTRRRSLAVYCTRVKAETGRLSLPTTQIRAACAHNRSAAVRRRTKSVHVRATPADVPVVQVQAAARRADVVERDHQLERIGTRLERRVRRVLERDDVATANVQRQVLQRGVHGNAEARAGAQELGPRVVVVPIARRKVGGHGRRALRQHGRDQQPRTGAGDEDRERDGGLGSPYTQSRYGAAGARALRPPPPPAKGVPVRTLARTAYQGL